MDNIVNLDQEGEELLSDILADSIGEFEDDAEPERIAKASATPAGPEEADKKSRSNDNHSQWALGGNNRYTPVGATSSKLPAGIYEPFSVPGMWGLELLRVASDNIYILPDMATQSVLSEVEKFWNSEDKYRQHKLLYKRGILLWGPPGGGKTVAVKLLINELIRRDGVVILVSNVDLAVMCIKAMRRIEPKRNLIVVFEDIDEIIYAQGENRVLSMLDGENNVDNILHIATTNYVDKLGARIVNRPSRFDRRVLVGMPSADARKSYLQQATNNGVSDDQLEKWVTDTKGLSIAHLRELVAAVYCLEQPYDEVIFRLQKMSEAIKIKDGDGFKRRAMGYSELPVVSA